MTTIIQFTFSSFLLLVFLSNNTHAQKFEPYELNGGLISAIAGPDYVVIASDTRLSKGYEILSRQHLSSRLWTISSTPGYHFNHNEKDKKIQLDGSVIIPEVYYNDLLHDSDDDSNKFLTFPPPVFIGSSGCASDCIALQRQLRNEMSNYEYINNQAGASSQLTPQKASTLLMNTLYNRRMFPFYSFCILAGLEEECGAVYVYDAIGSHERVAAASVGTGREMMQTILDRCLARPTPGRIAPGNQAKGNKLIPPVRTYVDCDCEEAVEVLVKAYRSVGEREIGVGDDLVVSILRRKINKGSDVEMNTDDSYSSLQSKSSVGIRRHTLEVRKFPLKKH